MTTKTKTETELAGGILTRSTHGGCACTPPDITENNLLARDTWTCKHQNVWVVRNTFAENGNVNGSRWGRTHAKKST